MHYSFDKKFAPWVRRLIPFLACSLLILSPFYPAEAQGPAELRKEFLQMFARAYFPGRGGQLLIVPREGTVITDPEPAFRFMHGSPWDYDTRIPLLLFGPRYINKGTYSELARHQDIVPTLAALWRIPVPATVTGQALQKPLRLSAGPPRVIFLAVLDGMRLDYFDRYSDALPTLRRLRQQGAWFSQARVNYLPTVTSVGHATIATGTDPRLHGITVNSTFDRIKGKQEEVFSGISPRDLMALTLADLWNLETDGQAVIIAQGITPRAVVPLAGRGSCMLNGRPVILASYSTRSGAWETNPECYRLPEYLKAKNARRLWQGTDGRWMGHTISNPEAVRSAAVFARFEADALIALIEGEPLGKDPVGDLVLVNLKTLDYVGHAFGPDSPEMREALGEMDRQFARILQALEAKVGADAYVLAITADHGMPSPPEAQGQKRIYTEDVVKLLHKKFDPEGGKLITLYAPESSQLFVDKNRLRRLGIKLSQIKEYLESQPYIFAAYTEDEVRGVDERRN